MKSGIFVLEKTMMDSIGVLTNRRDQFVSSIRTASDVSDNLSIRFGAVVIFVFSITIFAYMQRYYNQMKHFYLSRRNMLKLLTLGNNEIQSLGIEGLMKSLSSDHIEMKLPAMRNSNN